MTMKSPLTLGVALLAFPLASMAIVVESGPIATLFDVNASVQNGSFDFTSPDSGVFVLSVFSFKDTGSPSVTLDPTGSAISMTELVSAQSSDNGDLELAIFAADISGLSGVLDYEVSSSDAFRGAAFGMQLSGTSVANVVDTDSNGEQETALSLTGLPSGSFALDTQVDGSSSVLEREELNPYGTPDDTLLGTAPGNRGFAVGSYVDVSGDILLGYPGSAAVASAAVAFAPASEVIPEPSVLFSLLSGSVVVGLLLRRRK